MVRAVPDAAKQGAHLLEPGGGEEEPSLSQEDIESMSKEDLILAFTVGKRPFFKNKFDDPGRKGPPRDVSDWTCPNCNEKGHLGQDCPRPKVDLKMRKCFICGAPGCVAKTCPKKKAMAKALTAPG